MNLISEIDQRACALARTYKRAEAELVSVIQEIDRLRGSREFGFTSTFDYVLKRLRLSESCAYNVIAVARKTREIPEIQTALKQGKITVSKIKKVLSVITPANQREWIVKTETLSQRALEVEVARVAPFDVSRERVRRISSEICELRIPIDESVYRMIERVMDLRKTQSLAEALATVFADYLERRDPLRCLQKAGPPSRKRAGLKTSSTSQLAIPPGNRPHLPAATRREVLRRDEARCTHVDTRGVRCKNTRYVEIHHLNPQAWGGSHEPGNLAVLCSEHHSMLHDFLGS